MFPDCFPFDLKYRNNLILKDLQHCKIFNLNYLLDHAETS